MPDVCAHSGTSFASRASACGVASLAGASDSAGFGVGVEAGADVGAAALVAWTAGVGAEVGAGSVESPPEPPHACSAIKAAAKSAIGIALDLQAEAFPT